MKVATPQSLVAHFYDEEVTPERLQALLRTWDSASARSGTRADIGVAAEDGSKGFGLTFAAEIARAIEVLERDLGYDLVEVEAILRQVPGAAMVLSAETRVLTANEAARMIFGIQPGEAFACLPVESSGIDLLRERLEALELAPAGRDDVVQLRWNGSERVFHVQCQGASLPAWPPLLPGRDQRTGLAGAPVRLPRRILPPDPGRDRGDSMAGSRRYRRRDRAGYAPECRHDTQPASLDPGQDRNRQPGRSGSADRPATAVGGHRALTAADRCALGAASRVYPPARRPPARGPQLR
ncbi:hypothetical protein Rumeso_00226 [Rubellimicrobium mesophilum DSM 19309]|uniref:PAS domain-containing protein n=1 Tax=Rubellimicrobium mesophilum DSM 19309 TaxID=442562 RepID=A0A017HWP7_9RHOB|nr:hypothetical protein Rumeso_00226 [Rubellimicrobium mesophilum DSM 19309]